jgi:hypothetical protein
MILSMLEKKGENTVIDESSTLTAKNLLQTSLFAVTKLPQQEKKE